MDPTSARFARVTLAKALNQIDVAEAERQAFEDILEEMPAAGQSFVEHAQAHGISLNQDFWVLYTALIIAIWDKSGIEHAKWLPDLRRLHMADGDIERSLPDVLLDAIAEALQVLACEPDDESLADLSSALETAATACEALGDVDTAYDLLAAIMASGLPHGAERRRAGERALRLAEAAGKGHQIAVCASDVAKSALAMAVEQLTSRLDAFDAMELAVERVDLAPPALAEAISRDLCRCIEPHEWLHSLVPPLMFFVGTAEQREELQKIIGGKSWPDRVSERPMEDWLRDFGALFRAMSWEGEVERQRLALEPPAAASGAQADWVTWTMTHPGYSRSIPHHKSFMREAKFQQNVLVLTHETTHVLSFLGILGANLTALRVTALDNELSLASFGEGAADAFRIGGLSSLLSVNGVAPLEAGNAAALWRADRGIELTRKAQMLQDAWTPWFEGLAVFAEGAADPALDPVGITPVTAALRNLVDFHPTPGPSGIFDDPEQVIRQYEAFSEQFEQACSQAIASQGPARLFSLLDDRDIPYFEGYLAVRIVVASWRKTVGRPLTATECFPLLLHATRFGVDDFIPSLSGRADNFGPEATAAMTRWARQIATLPKETLEEFLVPPDKRGPGRPYQWRGGRLVSGKMDDAEAEGLQRQHLRTRVAEAFASLTNPQDVDRVTGVDAVCDGIVRTCDSAMRRRRESEEWRKEVEDSAALADRFITIGSLFPLGQTKAKFYFNRSVSEDRAFLMTQLRTTEDHVDGHRPSVNGYGIPVACHDSDQVITQYRLRGEPRMSVTRLIDLSGLVTRERLQGMHIFMFSYGDWVHLQGPSQAVDKLLRTDPDRLSSLTELAKLRLMPSAELSLELHSIAPGIAAARRTRDWIGSTKQWSLMGVDAPVEAWAALIKQAAEEVLDDKVRGRRQREAAVYLLRELLGNQELAANKALSSWFHETTKKVATEREAISDGLFRTAQKAGEDAWLEQNAQRLASAGFPFFAKSEWGWDVCPAA